MCVCVVGLVYTGFCSDAVSVLSNYKSVVSSNFPFHLTALSKDMYFFSGFDGSKKTKRLKFSLLNRFVKEGMKSFGFQPLKAM